MKQVMLVVLLLTAATMVEAQLYQKLQNGAYADAFNAICNSPGGGHLMAGYTDYNTRFPYRDARLLLTKTDSLGAVEWTRIYKNGRTQVINSIIASADGGYAASGVMQNEAGDSTSMFLLKLTATGVVSWIKYYQYPHRNATSNALVQTKDSGYILGGTMYESYNQGDAAIIKTDKDGNEQWTRNFLHVVGVNAVKAMVATKDGGVAIAAVSRSPLAFHIDADMFIIKLGATGNFQWANNAGVIVKYKGSTALEDVPAFIERTNDNGYVVGGTTSYPSSPQYTQPFVVKVSAQGNKVWCKLIPSDSCYRAANSAAESPNGDIVIAGTGSRDGSVIRPYVTRLTNAGRFIQSYFYTATQEPAQLRAVSAPRNGIFTAAGDFGFYTATGTDVKQAFFMSFDSKLRSCGSYEVADSSSVDSGFVKSIDISFFDVTVITTKGTEKEVSNGLTVADVCAVGAVPAAEALQQRQQATGAVISLAPTVVSSSINVTIKVTAERNDVLSIYSGQGRMVKQLRVSFRAGVNHQLIETGDLAAGMYYVVLQHDGITERATFIKQ